MISLKEIETIENHIEKTRFAGESVDETTFAILKKFLTDQLIECIGSPSGSIRRAAVRVSGQFTSMTKEHQKRVIFAMSNKMKM